MLIRLLAIALVAVPVAATAADPRPCELLSATEIASVVGAAPKRGQPESPDVDKDLGATAWTCGWPAGERFFAVRVARFRSAADATLQMSDVSRIAKSVPDGIRLAAAPGPGEQALWGSSDEGAIWVARKGPAILTLIVAGELNKPESLREPLRKLLATALGRLQ